MLLQRHLFSTFDFFVVIGTTSILAPAKQCKKACRYHEESSTVHTFLPYNPIRTIATKFEKDEVYSEKGITLHVFCHLLFFVLSILGCFLVSMGVYA